MQKILAKCHSLVRHFKHSVLASLIKEQMRLGYKKPLCVVQEVAKRWKSTLRAFYDAEAGTAEAINMLILIKYHD